MPRDCTLSVVLEKSSLAMAGAQHNTLPLVLSFPWFTLILLCVQLSLFATVLSRRRRKLGGCAFVDTERQWDLSERKGTWERWGDTEAGYESPDGSSTRMGANFKEWIWDSSGCLRNYTHFKNAEHPCKNGPTGRSMKWWNDEGEGKPHWREEAVAAGQKHPSLLDWDDLAQRKTKFENRLITICRCCNIYWQRSLAHSIHGSVVQFVRWMDWTDASFKVAVKHATSG